MRGPPFRLLHTLTRACFKLQTGTQGLVTVNVCGVSCQQWSSVVLFGPTISALRSISRAQLNKQNSPLTIRWVCMNRSQLMAAETL